VGFSFCSVHFPHVFPGSSHDEAINLWDIAEPFLDLFICDVAFDSFIHPDPQDLSDCCVMKGIQFFSVLIG